MNTWCICHCHYHSLTGHTNRSQFYRQFPFRLCEMPCCVTQRCSGLW